VSQLGLGLSDGDDAMTEGAEYPYGGEYTIQMVRDHAFVGPHQKGTRCRVCKRGQDWIEHLGFPNQLENDNGSHHMSWSGNKKMWHEAFGEALHLSGMPRAKDGIQSVQVVMCYWFAERHERDRDNLVYPTNKFFGDTLTRGRFREVPYEEVYDEGGYNISEHKVGRRPAKGKPVSVRDPLGGWIPDDTWQRYEVIETLAAYDPDEPDYGLDITLYPSYRPPDPWPPVMRRAR
jgi:hypothetical protein